MKVFLTQTAEDCLWALWDRHRIYSEDTANAFQRDIDLFMHVAIGLNREIGHVWHMGRGIRRLIFRRRHDIFYALSGDAAWTLFIFDGRMDINQRIIENWFDVDALLQSSND